MVSSRLPGDLTLNAAARAVEAMRARGAPILDLTETNPTRVDIVYPRDLLAPLADARGLAYEPHPLGLLSAREAAAADFLRRGLEVAPERLALTASTSEAYGFLFKLLCNAGDAVLVPRPSYPLFEHLTRLESVTAVPYDLDYHGTWRVDLDHVRSQLGPRVKAVLVVSPNNPTGSFLHGEDLDGLTRLAADGRAALIGDEVFADYDLDAAPGRVSVLEQSETLAVSLGGLSKSIGLPQVKLGWAAFGGPDAAVREAMHAFELIADTYLSVSTPVQVALSQLLSDGRVVRTRIQARTARNLARLRTEVGRWPAATLLDVQGGWSAVVQVPSIRSEEALVMELLLEEGVLVHPGYFFDFPREAFVVISLLVAPKVFDQAITRVLNRATTGVRA